MTVSLVIGEERIERRVGDLRKVPRGCGRKEGVGTVPRARRFQRRRGVAVWERRS
jgi:hypothetical protein